MNKKTCLFLLSVLIGFGMMVSGCSNIDEVKVTKPVTLAQYQQEMRQYVDSQLAIVRRCVIGYNKGDFKNASNFPSYQAAYLFALVADSAVINSPDVTIADMVAANATLSTPAKAFYGSVWISDRRALNDSIVSATALSAKVPVGSLSGQVLLDAKNIFTTAITTATTMRSNSVAIDRQINDAVTALNSARIVFISAIIPASIDVYVQNSRQYISSQKSFVLNTQEGYNTGQYLSTLRNNYLNSILEADTTVNTTGITFLQLSTSLNAMANPRNAFVPNLSDRRNLNDSIMASQTLYNSIVVGNASGQIAQTDKSAFNTAINTAMSVKNNPLSTDGNVKSAVYNLELSKAKFLLAIIP